MLKKLIISIFLMLLSVPVFAQSVDTAWVRRYNGMGNEKDEACCVAWDDSGNIYVSGRSNYANFDYLTIKYYPNGDTAWIRRYGGSSEESATAMVLDSYGNVYVTGYGYNAGTGFDYTTIKYDQYGNFVWAKTYNGTADANDFANAIAVDNSGNVYVAGTIRNSGTDNDWATIKYYPSGDTAWVREYIGLYDEGASDIACDDSGNVYVTGVTSDILTHYDCATIKYKPNGDTAWVRRYNGPQDSMDAALSIALDDSSNVYIAGATTGSGTAMDYLTIKYSLSGNQLWVETYNGPDSGNDGYASSNSIAIDNSGNIYVTGQSYGDAPDYYDFLTMKYFTNGDTAWVRRYNSNNIPGCAESRSDNAWALSIDNQNNVYVSGFSECGDLKWDYVTIKYDLNGNILWEKLYNGVGDTVDFPRDIAVDNNGNVYVTGASWGSGTYYDFATIKYVQFLRGDANNDGQVSISDIVYIINYLYKQGPDPIPAPIVGDANCLGDLSIADIVYLISYLYKLGPPPCI